MRVLVHEYACGGGLAGRPDLRPLLAEGWAMLRAVLQDFAALPGVAIATLLDQDLASSVDLGPSVFVRRIGQGEEEPVFRQEVRQADCTLVIAPETDDILLTRCRWVEESGGKHLGSTSEAIQLTGDKRALAQRWLERGLPTPRVWDDEPDLVPELPAVWKPRFGAGSQATFLIRKPGDLEEARRRAAAEGFSGRALVQDWVAGRPASVAWLVGPESKVPLLPAGQKLSGDGRFHYQGGDIPLPEPLAGRAPALSRIAIEAVPGLRGFVGVDLVLGDRDWLIEINPRLTTSYIGLRQLARTNLAGALLAVAAGKPAHLDWKSGSVRFSMASAEPL